MQKDSFMKYFHFLILAVLFLFTNCKQKENQTEKKIQTKNNVTYAKGFSIEKYINFSILKVTNAYPDSKETYTYILHKKNSIIPDSLKNFTAIQIPINKIIVTSTTHIPSLEMLGVETTLVAFPSTNYISSEKTRALIDKGNIREIGNNHALNTEVILDIQPDVIIGFSIDGDSKTYKMLEKNGQKIIFNADWTEKTPLGKAEWLRFFGALYDLDSKADSLFNSIKKNYNEAKELAKSSHSKPSIFSGAVYEDRWNLPKGDSWAATFLKEAHGNYLWKDTEGTGSLSLSFETVLDKAKEADFWIGPGQFTSMKQIKEANPNYNHFKAVQNQNVYSFSSKKGATGGAIYYELAPNRPDLVLKDIIKILHPEILPEYELYFFEQLK